MPTFQSDGVEIAYLDEGSGPPVLLIHGFASNKQVNWVFPSWTRTLKDAGFRVIAVDNRGHGESEKLYETEAYPATVMADDAHRLLVHLGIEKADVMGYSMGARISAFLSLKYPERVRSVVFGGLGINMVRGVGGQEEIITALLAEDSRSVEGEMGRAFRKFAEQTKSDLRALAACMGASRQKISAEEIGGLTVPALVAVGTKDTVGGSAEELAALIPGAEALPIEGRDHMVAVGDKIYKDGVLDFLSRRP